MPEEYDAYLLWKLSAQQQIDNFRKETKALRAENAKLRELCGELLDNLMSEICAKAWWCKGKDWRACDDNACGNYTFVILARELGVEQ